ncbi:OmpA family protein [Cytophagaceae bacterium DM2B3-1]|uniref:OmpA family protein n=1 Tax=Xanthocytophaga flava TaxID=3048013 RepID=A0ABT7CQJ6_9BACT|nr:OmpA family protein [Xanthocytophaga flavus]MDJ1470898.1 OmpA family protein [Xanthocytophaga flavus]MDJ1496021.1 OmpA family protein [Xanthocytophaga flavus]
MRKHYRSFFGKGVRLICVILLFSFGLGTALAQQVQWASRVIGFSSELVHAKTPKQYGAQQILGKPSKLPNFGNSACAWSPSTEGNITEEWIKVGYNKPMKVKQIAVAENYNAGSITRIYGYDSNDKEYLLYTNTKDTLPVVGRMSNIFIKETPFMVTSLKIMLNTSRIPGWNQIDAVAISSLSTPVKAQINLSPDTPKELKRENLGRGVNSVYEEICPVIAPDGKTLYFTRPEQPDNQDVWYAELTASKTFGTARRMPSPINTPEHNSSFSITPDGSTMLLNNIYRRDKQDTSRIKLYKGLSVTRKNGQLWGFPEQVQIQKYYNDNDFAEFSLAQSGQVLVMTAQREDSYGSKDLYVSFLQSNGVWSEPKNMGGVINTADAETSPFIASDGVTMYYSTPGLSGYGSMDIFATRRLDESWTKWSEPQNLGPAINSDAWDGYFTLPASGDYAYFVSAKNSFGGNDIFRVELTKQLQPDPVALVYGTVYDALTKKPIGAELQYSPKKQKGESGKASANTATGEYKMVLPLKEIYALVVNSSGYTQNTDEIKLEKDSVYKEIRKDIYLSKTGTEPPALANKLDIANLEVGKAVVLNNIMFEQGKFDLLEPSFVELDRVATVMKENPKMEIRLEGHTDNQGDFMLNIELSKNRVLAVKKYLESKGVTPERIQYKAYGGTQPLASNASEVSRKKNRRVEFIILKK